MGLILLAFLAVIHLFFAVGLLNESSKLVKQRIMFSPLSIWFLATLFGGPLVVLAFWIIHCSNLNESNRRPTEHTDSPPQKVLESLYEEGLLVHGNTVSNERVEEFLEQK